ncbi:hypothetical protein CAEBREN_04920 [Caenorhabditis brenneri]|uniref:Uncharacterized protein n=1 Tax=Caenorhabditis brenneri TaxID=135651 RepID=G0PD90_CAEBE|nr:hypothetical protein CAEBREN_04920 [Caenorhabditis brenneri]
MPLPLPPRNRAFRLPEHIREKIGRFRAVFVENVIEGIKDDLMRGSRSERRSCIKRIPLTVKLGLRMAEQNKPYFEEVEEIDEEELRLFAWNQLNGIEEACIGNKHEPRELEMDVMNWAKKIVTNPKQLELIELKQFTGFTLAKFLDSPDQWKEEHWPFGLYIHMKSHLNRVMNNESGYKFEFN